MIKDNSALTIISTLLISFLVFVSIASVTYSATDGSNVVINQVQISGTSATDEFVELYNPTGTDIDLTGWRLVRYSSTGTVGNLDSSLEGTIPAFGYYLLGHADYDGAVSLDEFYSTQNNISSNGAVRLYSDAGITVVDTVGFGTGVIFETQSIDTPITEGSVRRTNGLDTDNNFNDFIQETLSDPHNSSTSSATPTPSPTVEPTSTPTASASATPTVVPSPTATATPSASPSASPTIEPTPTASPSASPTQEPSPEPTVTPTDSPEASPTTTAAPSPTIEPTEAPVRSVFLASLGERSCRLEYRYVRFGFFRIAFPRIVCN